MKWVMARVGKGRNMSRTYYLRRAIIQAVKDLDQSQEQRGVDIANRVNTIVSRSQEYPDHVYTLEEVEHSLAHMGGKRVRTIEVASSELDHHQAVHGGWTK